MPPPLLPSDRPKRLRGLLVLAAGVGVASAVAWWTQRSPPAPPSATPGPAATGPSHPSDRPSSRVLAPRTTAAPRPAHPIEAVQATLAPDTLQVRCAAGGLADGRYDAVPRTAQLVQVTDGLLRASVPAGPHTVQLLQASVPAALLRWEDTACSVSPVVPTTVSGVLRRADGSPATDHVVRGCLHGELTRTDARGHWTLRAVQDTDCWPMAFVEAADGRFGRTEPVEVSVDGPVDGVSLTLPPAEALWSIAQQRAHAAQLARLFEHRLAAEQGRLDAYTDRATALSGDEAALAQAWLDHEAAFVRHVEGEVERLRDPEEQLDALREAWLSLN